MRGILLFAGALAFGNVDAHASWLEHERPIAIQKLRANISPAGTKPGTVIASPLRREPDYYFHWVRDAGLVMQGVFGLLAEGTEDATYRQMFEDYVTLLRDEQGSDALTGLGEPKFNVDGTPYRGDWGRPQNDGPALRAIALIQYARWKQYRGEDISNLYAAAFASRSVIKTDLEYVAHHWRDASFDLWEETLGDHFYTRMVQRRALVDGAAFARTLGDDGAANFYQAQAGEIAREIEKHWDAGRGYIVATLNWKGGVSYKHSGLDIAVILGVLHGYTGDGFFSYTDPRVTATARRLVEQFRAQYPINAEGPGVAIGRYPEDAYAGDTFDGGNPWVLTTLAMAELSYRQASAVGDMSLKAFGDTFVERVRRHAYPDGSLSEQIRKDNGFMTSATDLTWNYAAVLSALAARQAL